MRSNRCQQGCLAKQGITAIGGEGRRAQLGGAWRMPRFAKAKDSLTCLRRERLRAVLDEPPRAAGSNA
jgi:hypothetical protein